MEHNNFILLIIDLHVFLYNRSRMQMKIIIARFICILNERLIRIPNKLQDLSVISFIFLNKVFFMKLNFFISFMKTVFFRPNLNEIKKT